MSSPTPEPLGADAVSVWRARGARARVWLCRLRDLFALLGVVAVVLAAWLYQQGLREAGALAPETRRYLARAGWEALSDNVAGALSTRVAVAEGTTPEALESALRARADELGLPLAVVYPRPVPDGEELQTDEAQAGDRRTDYTVRVWTACDAQQIVRLVALEPRLLAFMPCHVALYRDSGGRHWLSTVNLELLVTGGREPVEALRREAVGVRDRMLDLIAAASG